jgi:putative oxidoreductase
MIATLLKSKELKLALRLLLGGMFLYAAWNKIGQPSQFAIAVRSYQIIPIAYSNLFAICLAWSEAVAGALLILGLFSRPSAGAIFTLLGMFVVALGTVLIKGMVIDCGCFGSEGGSAVNPWLIVRNIALMAACTPLMLHGGGKLSVDHLMGRNG